MIVSETERIRIFTEPSDEDGFECHNRKNGNRRSGCCTHSAADLQQGGKI